MPDEVRKALLIGLVGLGYADRIMVSHDCFGCGFGRGGVMLEEEREKVKNWNFTNIFRNILPAVKAAGITDKQIDTILVDNPARLFG